MNIDVTSVIDAMTAALRKAAGKRWSAVRNVMEPELRELALTIEKVGAMYASGEIDANRASELVAMQRNTAVSALKAIEGFGAIAARDAISAAARAAGRLVNRIAGFTLI